MDVFEVITKRTQVTKFDKKPVDDKLIGLILYSATQAASAGNLQEWEFVVVKDEEQKKRLYEASLKQEWVKEAPVDIVVCADLEKAGLKYGKRGELLYAIQDTAFAVENMLLAVHALGLGCYLVQAFDEDRVKTILELPDNLRPVAILPIGYPAGEPTKKKRIPFENLTWLDRYGAKYKISYVTQPGKRAKFKPMGEIIAEVLKEKFLERLARKTK